MIIDSHTHTGTIQYTVGRNKVYNLRKQDLLVALDKYSIDFALVSSIEGAEFDSERRLAPKEQQIPQLKSMEQLVTYIKSNKSKLKALLWIKPYTEKCDENFEYFIQKNKKFIAGLKIHPTLSNLKFTHNKYIPYLELARKYNLPVQVHSENDGKSNIIFIQKIAQKYKDVTFIMVHMGFNTNNLEAIDIIKRNRNIYGDICSVTVNNIYKSIHECGSKMILFGTDAIVNGIHTYKKYIPIISGIKSEFKKNDFENILYKNCARIYDLNIKD